MRFRRIAQLRSPAAFQRHLEDLGIEIPFDSELAVGDDAPLAQPYTLQDNFVIGNRFCIQPMEGWDGTLDGRPTELVARRWNNFGRSGAKLIWGGEAVAVCHEGRANPNQLLINQENLPALNALRQGLVAAHEEHHGRSDDLLVGLQLTHSGRFSRPDPGEGLKPVIAYNHLYLDAKFDLPHDHPVISDDELDNLVGRMVEAAGMACQSGFAFVDIKHCHGYLAHELLSAYTRPGRYGGSFENRTRFLRDVVAGIRASSPDLRIGVRLSVFDSIPFAADPETGIGVPLPRKDNRSYWFGASRRNPLEVDLREPTQFLDLLRSLGVEMVNLSAGIPYSTPHLTRPALFPPSDGYQPPEDPLAGVARQIEATAALKAQFPDLLIVGSAYSYLQEWLPHVAQYNVRTQRVDSVGLGRMVLSYPELPADVLAGNPLDRKRICRTFSDCTTAPRQGLVSGCYPLDDFYKNRPEAELLKARKERRT
jgi:2,4-dienoyl-CoA reductase-like NADH-dependent reductase (Old Yellow Enzyme family)